MKDKNAIFGTMDADIQCLKGLIKMIPVIKEQVKKFDGKVLNARLTNAINENTKDIGSVQIIPNEYNSSKIKFFMFNRSVKYTDWRGNSSWIYSDWYGQYILYLDNVLSPKRIDADCIIPHLDKFDIYCHEQIKAINSDKKKFDSFITKREALKKAIQQFNDIPKSVTGRKETSLSVTGW